MMSRSYLLLPMFCLGILGLAANSAEAGKRDAPVPPGRELEVLDPGVDPVGNPKVVLERPPGGIATVTIPPTVIVHKYYYTGDRCFQGPMLPGGPCIIVAHHPKTSELCYMEANLLPGAPRIHYKPRHIEYDYGKQRIVVDFGLCGCPKIVYRTGSSHSSTETAEANCIRDVGKQVSNCSKCVVNATAEGVRLAGTAVVTPVTQVVQSLPLVKTLSTSPEQRAAAARDRAVRRAAASDQNLNYSIPTNR